MTSKYFYAISIAAIAAAVSGIARADEADASQYVHQIEGQRTRAEVTAEAAQVARARSTEPAGSRVAAPLQSTLDPQTVRAQAIQALRLGQTTRGEI